MTLAAAEEAPPTLFDTAPAAPPTIYPTRLRPSHVLIGVGFLLIAATASVLIGPRRPPRRGGHQISLEQAPLRAPSLGAFDYRGHRRLAVKDASYGPRWDRGGDVGRGRGFLPGRVFQPVGGPLPARDRLWSWGRCNDRDRGGDRPSATFPRAPFRPPPSSVPSWLLWPPLHWAAPARRNARPPRCCSPESQFPPFS
jgi:hypothetical protein